MSGAALYTCHTKMERLRFFFFLTHPSHPPSPSSVLVCPLSKQYICCWNGSTTSGGQVLVSILSTLEKERKKSIRVHLSCISHSIVALQWDLFSSGRFNTWAGQWKESNRVGWRGVGSAGGRGLVLWRRRPWRNCERGGWGATLI